MADFAVQDLSPAIGAVVIGLDLARDGSDTTMRRLIDLLHDRGVVVIKGQHLPDADYARFGSAWGRPIEFFIVEHRDVAHPEIIRIDNNPATPEPMRDGAVHWHSDADRLFE